MKNSVRALLPLCLLFACRSVDRRPEFPPGPRALVLHAVDHQEAYLDVEGSDRLFYELELLWREEAGRGLGTAEILEGENLTRSAILRRIGQVRGGDPFVIVFVGRAVCIDKGLHLLLPAARSLAGGQYSGAVTVEDLFGAVRNEHGKVRVIALVELLPGQQDDDLLRPQNPPPDLSFTLRSFPRGGATTQDVRKVGLLSPPLGVPGPVLDIRSAGDGLEIQDPVVLLDGRRVVLAHLTGMGAGPYHVEVQAPGFYSSKRSNVVLDPNCPVLIRLYPKGHVRILGSTTRPVPFSLGLLSSSDALLIDKRVEAGGAFDLRVRLAGSGQTWLAFQYEDGVEWKVLVPPVDAGPYSFAWDPDGDIPPVHTLDLGLVRDATPRPLGPSVQEAAAIKNFAENRAQQALRDYEALIVQRPPLPLERRARSMVAWLTRQVGDQPAPRRVIRFGGPDLEEALEADPASDFELDHGRYSAPRKLIGPRLLSGRAPGLDGGGRLAGVARVVPENGVLTLEGEEVVLRGLVIEDLRTLRIRGSGVVLEECELFFRENEVGVDVEGEGVSVELRGCTLHAPGTGLRVRAGGVARLWRCHFVKPRQDGLACETGGSLTADRCRVIDAGDSAVRVAGGRVVLEACQLQDSGDAGVRLEAGKLELRGGNVTDSHGPGLSTVSGSTVRLAGPIFRGNHGAAIVGEALLQETDLSYQHVWGNGDATDERWLDCANELSATVQPDTSSSN